MKFSLFIFALVLSSSIFANTNVFDVDAPIDNSYEELLLDALDKEICYTASVSGELSIPVLGGVAVGVAVEVTGCGETAGEAMDALLEGVAEAIKLGLR